MEGIRFVYFNVGYTLICEDKVWAARCAEQAAGAEARALGLSADDIFAEIEEASRNYLPQYKMVAKKFGFREAAPYRAELEFLYPEAKPTLEYLARKYRLGVLANQSDGLQKRLEEYGIARYFSAVVSSFDCGVSKPEPAIFRIAIERAGVAPSEIVMVGDRLDNDIFPAKALGMRTIWVKQGFGGLQQPRSAEYEPTAAVESLAELRGIL